jgi:tRNA(adenine34) deaminase
VNLGHLRAAIALSRRASERGDEPYAALLADARGAVRGEALNTEHTARDCTGHAELNLLREASRLQGRDALAGCTVYASGEPCPMCAGAIFWAGVRRVVFALDIATMHRLAGDAADELLVPCHEILARGTRRVEVAGPLLADEAAAVLRLHYARRGRG